MQSTASVPEALLRAQKKFEQLDVNLNGTLEAEELTQLLEWVLAGFDPLATHSATPKLLARLAQNDDGVLDFEEFSDFFEQTFQPSRDNGGHRQNKLRAVFSAFDLDGSGSIEIGELSVLGQARRDLGHKSGEWTDQQNQALMAKLDTNGDGRVSCEEFVSYFDEALSSDQIMQQFMQVIIRPRLQPTPPQPFRSPKSGLGLNLPSPLGNKSPRELFMTTPGRSPRAMLPSGSKANTVLNAARGIFDVANKTQNDVLHTSEIEFLIKQVWALQGVNADQQQLKTEVEAALVQYGTGEQFVTFMQFLRMITKHPWHLLLPSDLQSQLGVKSPSKGLPITPRERDSPHPGGAPPARVVVETIGAENREADVTDAAPVSSASSGHEMHGLIPKARDLFQQMDNDKSGTLEREELTALAQWVFSNFHPEGEALSDEQRNAEADKLMKRLDKNEDGRLDFEEFEAWMKRTSASIAAFRTKNKDNPKYAKQSKEWMHANAPVASRKVEPVAHTVGHGRSVPDPGTAIANWNAAASGLQTVYTAAQQLFMEFDVEKSGVLSAENLMNMVRAAWSNLNTPIPKSQEEQLMSTCNDAVKQHDKTGVNGVTFPAFVRMVTKKPWSQMLPESVRREMNVCIKTVIPNHRIQHRRQTGAKPTVSGDTPVIVKRITDAIRTLFIDVTGSENGILDHNNLEKYCERVAPKSRNKEKLSHSVMTLCDRVIQGGLCLADFTRVAVREPFVGMLPPSAIEDLYFLIDRAASGKPHHQVDHTQAHEPPVQPIQPPSDTIKQSSEHIEQARRELGKLARNEGLRRVFDKFDSDSNGFIDGREFVSLAKQVAKAMVNDPRGRLSESEARSAVYTIIKRIDVNSDGRISFREFEDFIKEVAEEKPKAKPQSSPSMSSRQDRLHEVFQAFDINGDGTIGYDELLALGQARRKLGQKQGEWTHEMNKRMLSRMDRNGDGRVVANEFVNFFDDLLPRPRSEFDENIQQFMQVAMAVRNSGTVSTQSDGTAVRERREPRREPPLPQKPTPKREPKEPRKAISNYLPGELEVSGKMSLSQKNARIDYLHSKLRRTSEESNELRRLEASVDSRAQSIAARHSPKPSPMPKNARETAREQQAKAEARLAAATPIRRTARKHAVLDAVSEREKKLKQVFQAFDLNGDGTIGADELLALGRQRRKLGQKSGEWTIEMNNRLMKKLDTSGDGRVQMREFIDFFDEQLPSAKPQFIHHCDAFLQVAGSLREQHNRNSAPAEAPAGGRVRAMQQAIEKMATKDDDEIPTSPNEQQAEELTLGLFAKPDETLPEEIPDSEQLVPGKTNEEFEKEVDAEFSKWDHNKDGVIDKSEFTQMRAAAAQEEAKRIRAEARNLAPQR